MDIIQSKTNKKIQFLRSLFEKAKERRKNSLYIAEGMKMVNEALSLGISEEVYLSESLFLAFEKDGYTGSLHEEVRRLKSLLASGNKKAVISDALFQSISGTVSPQGVLSLVRIPEYHLEDLLFSKTKIRLLVLEDVSDPGNLGTILRTAEAAGITAVLLSHGTVDIFNPKVVRATMGSIFRLPFLYLDSLPETIQLLQKAGFVFYAAHLKGRLFYNQLTYPDRTGLLIGNEARGLSEEVSRLSDTYVKIPMEGKVESLNAAIAAAIMMYEMK